MERALVMTSIIVILIIIFLLLVSLRIFRTIYVSPILSMLLIGILMGPNGFNIVERLLIFIGDPGAAPGIRDTIESFYLLGIIFIMALAGMEIDQSYILSEKNKVMLQSAYSVIIPGIVGIITAIVLQLEYISAFLLSAVFITQSIGVVFIFLDEMKLDKTRFGTILLGSTMVCIIISTVILSITIEFQRFLNPEFLQPRFSVIDIIGFDSLFTLGLYLTGVIIIFLVVGLTLIPKFLVKLVYWFMTVKLQFSLIFLFIILLYSVIGSYLGINPVIGAFTGGFAISRSGLLKEFENIPPILNQVGYGLFVPFMFYYIGAQTDITMILDINNIFIIVLLVIMISISKTSAGYVAMRKSGFGKVKSLGAGILSVPRLTASLIIAGIGITLGIFTQEIFTSIVILAFITSISAPSLVRYLFDRYNVEFFEAGIEPPSPPEIKTAKSLVDEYPC
jgi:Kef-type K+ transport system membrane component KefB